MNLKLLFALLLANLTLHAQIPTNGLVAYFPFRGNARDSSVNKTHGTVLGATLTNDRFGNPNAAYSFNGSSRIQVPTTNLTNNKYSYSLWAKVNTIPSNGNMAFAFNIGSSGGDQSINIANNYAGTFNGWLGGGYNTVAPNFALNEGKALSTSSWTHIVCVRDSNNITLYVNGLLVDSIGSGSVKYPFYGNGPVKAFIGIRNDMSAGFKGIIDDVCIFNRVISKQEIQQLFNDLSTNISDINAGNLTFNLYPNPSSNGAFTIDLTNDKQDTEITDLKLFNSIGQEFEPLLFTKNAGKFNLEFKIPPGIYIIRIRTLDGRTGTRTVIIN